jgi:UDP-N-acetylmuramoyl-L-alanyl-D-glutamate--2,6-diaminopimelate ligase
MKLRGLLTGVPLMGGNLNQDMEISSISYDTRTICPAARGPPVTGTSPAST